MCDMSKAKFFRPWKIIEETESLRMDTVLQSVSTGSETIKSELDEDNDSLVSSSNEINRKSVSTCSSNSSDDLPENGSLDMLSNFVFGARSDEDVYDRATTERASTDTSPSSCTPIGDSTASAFTPTHHQWPSYSDYLAQFTTNATVAQYEAYQTQLSYYGLPTIGISSYPSMEEAVKLIHQQDIAAKQMKKLRPKKFRCQHCNVAFSNNGQLKGHIRIHTGERPFKCDAENCGKSFTRNEELTRHKRIHTGQRPHACLTCGKRFGRKDHLKKHTRTHENRGPYHMPSPFSLGHHSLSSGHYPLPPFIIPM